MICYENVVDVVLLKNKCRVNRCGKFLRERERGDT